MLAEHIGLSDNEYSALSKEVALKEQMQFLRHFTVDGSMHSPKLGIINILYYIDRHGTDFIRKQSGGSGHQKMARAMYRSLNTPDKITVLKYAEGHDENWKEENENDN